MSTPEIQITPQRPRCAKPSSLSVFPSALHALALQAFGVRLWRLCFFTAASAVASTPIGAPQRGRVKALTP